MAGVAALYRPDGAVSRADFEAVFGALDHRNWDGRDAVVRDRVAIGHQHAHTTPEEVGERQPIGGDGVWIAFDGRLDNRDEVVASFESAAELGDDPTDAELALAAYRTCDEAFLEHLLGSFAVVVWDGPADRLLLGRDRTDVSWSLYYADRPDAVVVASEVQAILRHPALPASLDEVTLAAFLADAPISPHATFYEAVRTVPPGSFVEVTANGSRCERYWKPWNASPPEVPSATTAADAFRALLERAVRSRLRARRLPGIMLSGGLDSTTVAGAARRAIDRDGSLDGRLHGFTMVCDDPRFASEMERVREAASAFDVRSHLTAAGDDYTLADVELYERLSAESPGCSALVGLKRRLYERATELDRTVLLTGIGGNMYDGSRLAYADLVRRGRLVRFLRDARADPMPVRDVLKWFVLVPSSDWAARLVRRRHDLDDGVPAWLTSEFVERTGIEDAGPADPEASFDSLATELQYHAYYWTGRRFEAALDRRAALEAGIALRTPLLDARLLSLLFSLPGWETFEAGREKVLFRRAMDGILPETVRTQTAAVIFDRVIRLGITRERRGYVDRLLAESRLAARGIVEDGPFRAHLAESLDAESVGSLVPWRLLTAELWLDGHAVLYGRSEESTP